MKKILLAAIGPGLLAALLLPHAASAQSAAAVPEPPRRFMLGLRATAQQYDVMLGGYPFGQRRALVRPVQLTATYRISPRFSLQTGAAWHTTSAQGPRRYLTGSGKSVEGSESGRTSIALPLLLRYAYLPRLLERRWNGYLLAGATLLLHGSTLTERDLLTGISEEYDTTANTTLMPTFGAGSSYRLGRRWQAEAEVWFSRSAATGFAPQNFGVALGAAFGL